MSSGGVPSHPLPSGRGGVRHLVLDEVLPLLVLGVRMGSIAVGERVAAAGLGMGIGTRARGARGIHPLLHVALVVGLRFDKSGMPRRQRGEGEEEGDWAGPHHRCSAVGNLEPLFCLVSGRIHFWREIFLLRPAFEMRVS